MSGLAFCRVVKSEPMHGWWNVGAGIRDWFVTLSCGRSVIRRGAKPPAKVRCCPAGPRVMRLAEEG